MVTRVLGAVSEQLSIIITQDTKWAYILWLIIILMLPFKVLPSWTRMRELTVAGRIPAVVLLQWAVLSIKVFGTMTVISVSHIEAFGAIFTWIWITQICISLEKTCQVHRLLIYYCVTLLFIVHKRKATKWRLPACTLVPRYWGDTCISQCHVFLHCTWWFSGTYIRARPNRACT